MNLLQGLSGISGLSPGSILTIGNFDGIHRGHKALLALARRLRAQSPGSRIAAVTFEPHPLTALRPEKAPPRITSPEQKRRLLDEQGVDDLVELAPEPEVLNLTAEEFWAILRDEVRPAHLIEGMAFNFGKGRGGNVQRLREWSSDSGVKLHVVEELEATLMDMRLATVSSTVIRWLIAYGRVRDAAICLGRPFALQGKVIQGYQRGRELGFPTANLQCESQLIPPDGVYAGRCQVDGRAYGAAISIGTLPTFGHYARQIEAHLIDYDGDLYEQTIELEMIDWLREQRKYPELDGLKLQIHADVEETRLRMNLDVTRAIGAA